MTTYTVTFEETKFLPVRQYEAKTLDSLMYFIQAEKMTAEYDLTVTLSKIERDDEMPIKGEIVDFVEFVIRKDKSAYEAEISKWKGVAEYRNKQIEQLEQQIRELKGELYAGKEQIRQLKETNEHLEEKCEELLNEKWDAQDDLDCYYDEMPTRIKQAVQDFAEKIKAKSYVTNYCREVVEIDKIDELLKEYENGKDKD